MNKKSKSEKLFVLLVAGVLFASLFMVGCSGSCFGCTIGCETDKAGCATGFGYESDGCGSDDSCVTLSGCVDWDEPYDDGSGKVLILSCDATEESGCGGENGCFNGLFCSACGTCGVFCGEREDYDVSEITIGCMEGCLVCGDTEGVWNHLLNWFYAGLGLK